ncbi:MAG: PQQ-binding-like beta-propeller repeat protein [Thermacetogeniaceae bacterium]
MKRFLIVLTVLLLLIQMPTAQAAPSLKEFDATPGAGNQAQIIWELKGLGRLSGDMQFAPNGQILLPLAGQLAAVDTGGGLQWNVKAAGGNLSYPVCTANGSIYAPSSSSIQELEPDGAPGWAFTVYPSAGGTTNQWLGYGQDNLYFPLASGLYILDLDGRLVSLSPWDTSELQATKLPLYYNFLAGTVTGSACYTIVSTDTDQYQMSVFDAKGNYLWDYGLDGLKQAYIATGGDGTVFLAAEPTIINQVSHDIVYSFAPNSSQPQWQTYIDENINFLGLSLATAGSLYLALAGKIYALDTKTGAIKWDVLFTDLVSPVAVDNKTGYIYAGCSDGRLIAVDPTGKLSWELSLDASISRAPLVGADGFLYVATDSDNLYKVKLPSSNE